MAKADTTLNVLQKLSGAAHEREKRWRQRFDHYPASELPEGGADGVRLRVMAGRAFGLAAPFLPEHRRC